MKNKIEKHGFTYYEATLCNGETIDLPLIAEISMVENSTDNVFFGYAYEPDTMTFEYVGHYYPDEVAVYIDANFDDIQTECLKDYNW